MNDKLLRWLAFTVAFAVFAPAVQIPLLYTYGLPRSSDALFGQGELLMVVVGISFNAVGDLISSRRGHHGVSLARRARYRCRIFLTAVNLCFGLMASAWYGNVSAPVGTMIGRSSRVTADVRQRIAKGSLWMLAVGLVVGAISVVASNEEER